MLFWHRSKFERRKAGGSAAAQQGGASARARQDHVSSVS
jgi:hypothetical protein